MSNLAVRILTGVIAGAGTVAAIWASPVGLFVFCFLVSTLGWLEFLRITGVKNKGLIGLAVLESVLAWTLVNQETLRWWTLSSGPALQLIQWFCLLLVMPVAGLFLLFDPGEKKPVVTLSAFLFGAFYALVPFILLFLLSAHAMADYDHPSPGKSYATQALGIFFLVWATDVFAYFGGRFLGRHKLFERISPKKTWEGSLVGAAACIGTGFLLQAFWPLSHWDWRIAAALVAPLSQLGDLVESMFKRSLDLKDSGGILPGHGGLLDRFDGFLFSMPFLWVLGMVLTVKH